MKDSDFMQIALEQAKKCDRSQDVPVGAIITKDGKIISRAYNQKEKKHSPLCHAEILAIKKACKKLKSSRLDGAVIYTTKEPCLMCMGAILSSRIAKVVFGAEDLRFGTKELGENNKFNHKCEVVGGILKDECSTILTDFFKKIR